MLLGAASRGLDRPGSLRRYRVDPTPPTPAEVQRCLEESVGGVVDIDHTLAVARHWGGFPADTVVLEVEPADCSFGLGFSEELAGAFDPVLTAVHEELGWADPVGIGLDLDAELAATSTDPPGGFIGAEEAEPSVGLSRLVNYADLHRQVRLQQRNRGVALLRGTALVEDRPGFTTAARSIPWGVGLKNGGNGSTSFPSMTAD